MKINFEDNKIELTDRAMARVWTVYMMKIWQKLIMSAIDRNSDNLKFPDEKSKQNFIEACMDEKTKKYLLADVHAEFDELIFDVANAEGLWSESEAE